jgi:hypothetical protein
MVMNERIVELIKQSGTDVSGKWMSMYQVEKFAELIVAECLGIVHDAERGGSNEIWDNAVKFIRRDLQEHFGVER